jgi:hypothetical protein
VIDDVQGLVILAVVTGIIGAASQTGTLSYGAIGVVVLKAVIFLFGSLTLGVNLSSRLFTLAAKLDARRRAARRRPRLLLRGGVARRCDRSSRRSSGVRGRASCSRICTPAIS